MPKLAANLTMMFNEADFLDRFELAAKAGFKAVEVLFPYEYEIGELAERIGSHGLSVALHNLPAGDWASGDRGIACQPDRVGEFQDGVGMAIEYALALGCTQLNCLAGIPQDSSDAEVTQNVFLSNLKFASNQLAEHDLKLNIEPINSIDIPGFYLNHTVDAVSIIEQIDTPNLKLQYDVYHMQIMEGDLVNTIRDNIDIIGHIQIADNPGRNEPGTGEIYYPFVLNAIDGIGYEGWVGCEYRPLTTTIAGIYWADPYLKGQT